MARLQMTLRVIDRELNSLLSRDRHSGRESLEIKDCGI